MCIIIVKRVGTRLPLSQLQEATWNNGDGIGYYCRYSDGSYRWGKNINDRGEEWEIIQSAAQDKDALLVFHARIATHGTTSSRLCHPFYMPQTKRLLFHNGMINGVHCGSKTESDTSCFARLLDDLIVEGFTPKSIVNAFRSELGWSKLVSVLPELGRLAFFNRSSFIERARGKLLYSNESAFVKPCFITPKKIDGFSCQSSNYLLPKADYGRAWDNVRWDDFGNCSAWDLDS